MSLIAAVGARIPHGEEPLPCPNGFRERFTSGLTPYTITGGDVFELNPGDTYGTSLSLLGGPITGFGSSAIRTDVVTTGITNVKFKVKLDLIETSGNPDDGPIIVMRTAGGAERVNFCPAREKFFDATQRPHIAIGGGTYQALGSSGHLEVGTWYQVEADWSAGSSCTVTVTNLSTLAVFASKVIAAGFAPYDLRQLLFADTFSFGGSDTKPGATYADILLC